MTLSLLATPKVLPHSFAFWSNHTRREQQRSRRASLTQEREERRAEVSVLRERGERREREAE